MKQIKVKVLILDLPAFTADFKCIIQIGKVSHFAESAPELLNIKGTELNEFLDNPAEDFMAASIKKQFNPLLEHKGEEIGEIVFEKAKLIKDKTR